MNVAIVIGVSKYTSSVDLPACMNDAKSVHEILRFSEKYQEIVYINENQSSTATKKIITEFVGSLKGKIVEEIFFYYSGHGEFYKDEFYYIMPDFDSKKRNQTTIQNSEIDQLFRGISPSLMVKVIDACQSGTSYVKANDVLDSYLKKTAHESFKSCYFIYSSLGNQSSYATSEVSHFTSSFIGAIKNHTGETIRFKDVIDVVVDEFASDSQQTPFFVIQGDLTEKFISLTKKIKDYFAVGLEGDFSRESEPIKPLSLAERVKQEAKKYTNKEGALKILQLIKGEISAMVLKKEIQELYTISSAFLEEYTKQPSKEAVAKWLRQNPKEYFANPVYIQAYDEEFDHEYTMLDGFNLKLEVPYKEIFIDVIGLYPNVTSYNCCVLFFLSKRSIRFFYCIGKYVDLNFEERTLDTKDVQWITTDCDIADEKAVKEKIKEIRSNIENLIESDLNSRLNPESDDLPF